jgi:cytochrome c oxidase subunit II
VDTAVTLNVTSTDVLHRWSVPALGGKADAVPGQVNTTWFKAEEEGSYEGASYAYSGPSYPTMRTRVTVVSAEEYESFVEAQQRELSAAQDVVRKAAEAEAAQEGEGAPATEGGAE